MDHHETVSLILETFQLSRLGQVGYDTRTSMTLLYSYFLSEKTVLLNIGVVCEFCHE